MIGEKGLGSVFSLRDKFTVVLLESSEGTKVIVCLMTTTNSGVIDPETSPYILSLAEA